MKELFIGLATMVLVLSGMLLRSSAKVAITMAVLWLMGTLFPFVASALGLPQHTFYDFLVSLFGGVKELVVWAIQLFPYVAYGR